MKGPIFEPRGRAREYSPYALNIYDTCAHMCDYCYCKRKSDSFDNPLPTPADGLADRLRRQLENWKPSGQVLLSFTGDPFSPSSDENATTIECLSVLADSQVPTAVLTKGGKRILPAMDVMKSFGNRFQAGATLTFIDDGKSSEWEPGAASPSERMEVLKELHNNGIRTFASLEPVVEPDESIALIEKTLDYVDVYKVGKLNEHKGLDETIDWEKFLVKAVAILREAGKLFYIKNDLAAAAPNIALRRSERIADDMNVR